MRIIRYSPDLDIRNVDALPRGLGAKYLLVVEAPEPSVYIAKEWKRKEPQSIGRGEVLVQF